MPGPDRPGPRVGRPPVPARRRAPRRRSRGTSRGVIPSEMARRHDVAAPARYSPRARYSPPTNQLSWRFHLERITSSRAFKQRSCEFRLRTWPPRDRWRRWRSRACAVCLWEQKGQPRPRRGGGAGTQRHRGDAAGDDRRDRSLAAVRGLVRPWTSRDVPRRHDDRRDRSLAAVWSDRGRPKTCRGGMTTGATARWQRSGLVRPRTSRPRLDEPRSARPRRCGTTCGGPGGSCSRTGRSANRG